MSEQFNKNTFFRIIRVSGNFNNTYYKIEKADSNNKLINLENNDVIMDKINTTFELWNIKKIRNNSYIMKNINNCYIVLKPKLQNLN